jgi:hypothetical protein
MLTLAEAARRAGTSKTSMFRAIKSGRISATKADDGTYQVAEAELNRFLDTASAVAQRARAVEQPVAADGAVPDTALRERVAALEAHVEGLKALVDSERRRAERAESNSEAWQRQAEQAQRLLTDMRPAAERLGERRPGWLSRLFRKAG